MSVAVLPLHFNRVHSSCTGSLSKITSGVESETTKALTQNCERFFGIWISIFFSPPSFNRKTIKVGISFFVITIVLIKTSAREGFYGGFVWKFGF